MSKWLIVLSAGLLVSCQEKERVEGTDVGDCTDNADNDGDGAFDCDDEGCVGSPDCDNASDEDNPGDEEGDEDTDSTDPEPDADPEVEAPSWSGVWMVSMNLNYTCFHSVGDSVTADEDNEQQTVMLQLSGPENDLYAATPGTDSSWSMAGAGDENGLFLGGSLRMEVDGDPIDYTSNVTINATDIISENEVHGTIFGSFSANSSWWECEFKDEPSTVILTQ